MTGNITAEYNVWTFFLYPCLLSPGLFQSKFQTPYTFFLVMFYVTPPNKGAFENNIITTPKKCIIPDYQQVSSVQMSPFVLYIFKWMVWIMMQVSLTL